MQSSVLIRKNINKAQLAIDKKDIFGLVAEYKAAKISKNDEEAQELYTNIQKIYKRLPAKDQEKIFKMISGGLDTKNLSSLSLSSPATKTSKPSSKFYSALDLPDKKE